EQYHPAPRPQKKIRQSVNGWPENCAATAVPWITDAGLRACPAESTASARVAKRAAATLHTNILIAGGHSHGKPNASRSAFGLFLASGCCHRCCRQHRFKEAAGVRRGVIRHLFRRTFGNNKKIGRAHV